MTADSITSHFDFHALGNLYLHAFFANSGDFAINTTNGDNLVANLQAVE